MDSNTIELILNKLEEQEIAARDLGIAKHVLSGGTTRTFIWEGKAVNESTVSGRKKEVLPYIITKGGKVSIDYEKAPIWLQSKTTDNLAEQEAGATNANNDEQAIIELNRQISWLESELENTALAANTLKYELEATNKKLLTERGGLIQDIEAAKEEIYETKEANKQLKNEVEKLTPKWDRGFILQACISIGWLLGLIALSVFSVENMYIFFNTVSFWLVAIIVAAFVEFSLWAINFARFSGIIDDIDSLFSLQKLSTGIFLFRAFANSLGSYYIAINASEVAKGNGLYSNIVSKFTDINELYFGFHVGSSGMSFTAIIVGLFVAYLEYEGLPLAIKHFNGIFIKR